MAWVGTILGLSAAVSAALVTSLAEVGTRLDVSRAKRSSITDHGRMARWLASLIPFYEYEDLRFFGSDDAPAEIVARRHEGFMRLSERYRTRFAQTIRRSAELADGVSDLQFTDAYRVPFQYSRFVRRHFPTAAFAQSSTGVTLTDLDGNQLYDVGGSYGVNVLGYEAYKGMIERGIERVGTLGPVLGPYHPIVAENVGRLTQISGLDEVSFHMSGTEAVMQAVRLARYHTGRSHLVRFRGAYHGWWGDVQPGIGNPLPARETYTLKELSEDSLRVLRRRRDVACVLVNPLQALHPNVAPPADSSLIGGTGGHRFDRAAYADWLRRLRKVCSSRGIVLIFDEVLVGFRLGIGGAQEYFGVAADLVTYGKTVGGGLPIGVLCGRADLMKRFRDDRPLDICFARGTFNSHPYVMAAMNEFVRYLETPQARDLYDNADAVWSRRAGRLNERLRAEGLPIEARNLSSIWSIQYARPSRYNWMLQFYLRAEGLMLGWIGTGRLIFSLDYDEADFAAVVERFVAAARAMQQDGWWWTDPRTTDASIRRRILKEMLVQKLFAARERPGR